MKNERFSKEEIEEFKQQLLSKRHELLEDRSQLEDEGLSKTSKSDKTGDITSVHTHMADMSADMFQQEVELGRLEREGQEIREIDAAIEKIENGEFGICELNGEEISKERLHAIPWTRYCIECESKREKSI